MIYSREIEREVNLQAMSSRRKHKKSPLNKKLKLLRSITDSQAQNGTSVISDGSKYIHGLMEKGVEKECQSSNTDGLNSVFPVEVKFEAQETKGFLIKVFTQRRCPGLLVFILEAFEDLGLDVLHARVSCSGNFCLEALGIIEKGWQNLGLKDAEITVEQKIVRAIQSWSEVSKHL